MGLIVNIVLDAPDLPVIGPWFVNSAAFTNYLNAIPATAEITAAATTAYVPVGYDQSIAPAAVNIDGNDYILITLEMFLSLRGQIDALNASYQDLRVKLAAAGITAN